MRLLLLAAAGLLFAAPASADTLLVPAEHPDIQSALDAAAPGDTVLVADGTYTGPGNRDLSFGAVPVTLRSENGPFETILAPQGAAAGFVLADEPAGVVIEGFTVAGASGIAGGAFAITGTSRVTVRDCRILNNGATLGGGVFTADTAAPTFEGCWIARNTADFGGGVYATDASAPVFMGCTLAHNGATDGGAVFVDGAAPVFTNCALAAGTSTRDGAAVFVFDGHVELTHVTITSNQADGVGGGVALRGPGSATLTNAILWDDSAAAGPELALLDGTAGATATVRYSNVDGGVPAALVEAAGSLTWGPGNIDADPLFLDPVGGDPRPTAGSPVIDAGDPATVPAQPFDVLGFGHPRRDDGDFDFVPRVDMGAWEFGGLAGPGEAATGELVTFDQAGLPGANFGVFLGLPGPPLDLGPDGTVYLDVGGPFLLLLVGNLGPTGTATVIAATLPPEAAGFTLDLQAAQEYPWGALHWTNLETLVIAP